MLLLLLLLLQDGPHLYWPLFPLPHHNADQPRCIMPPAAGCKLIFKSLH
jgi:hypothetical protein